MNFIILTLLAAAFGTIQCLLGGTRLVLAYPAYAILSIAAIVSLPLFRKQTPKVTWACVVSALLLAGYVLFRIHETPYSYLARSDFYTVIGALIVYFLAAFVFTDSRKRMWLFAFLFLIAIAEVVVGALQFSKSNGFMLFGFLRADESARASGMFISGNHFAGYLEAIAAFALSFACWSRWPLIARLCCGYVVVVCYFGVAISGSRGGYISTTFSLILFSLLSVWIYGSIRPRRAGLLGFFTILALAIGLFGAGILMLRSSLLKQRVGMFSTMSTDMRVYNWKGALDQFGVNPLTGTGPGTHLPYGRLFRRPQLQFDPVHAHSDYLETLCEYGTVGLLLAIIFLATHIWTGVTSSHQLAIRRLQGTAGPARSDTLALTIGAFSAAAGLVSHSVVDFNMHIPGNALFFSFIFGILASPAPDREAQKTPLLSPVTLFRLLLPPLGLACLYSIAPLIKGEELAEEARVALRDHQFQDCIQKSKDSIDSDPLNPYPYFYAGEANRAIGLRLSNNLTLRKSFFSTALEFYEKGVAIAPYDETFYVRMGQALDGSLQFKDADSAYQKAMELDPNLGRVYAYYAAHLHLLGRTAMEKQYRAEAARLDVMNANTGMTEAHSASEVKSDPAQVDDGPAGDHVTN